MIVKEKDYHAKLTKQVDKAIDFLESKKKIVKDQKKMLKLNQKFEDLGVAYVHLKTKSDIQTRIDMFKSLKENIKKQKEAKKAVDDSTLILVQGEAEEEI